MQADSEKLRQAWIKAVQNSIATAFRDKGDDNGVKAKHSQTDYMVEIIYFVLTDQLHNR